MMSFASFCLFLLLSHTGISGILLSRKAESLARWHIPLYWTVLGQFAVSVVALAIACGIAIALSVLVGLGEAAFFALALLLFLPCWAIGQAALISRLAAGVKRKFLSSWTLRRVNISTASSILVVYVSVGIAGFGALQYVDHAKPAEMQVAPADINPPAHALLPGSPAGPVQSDPGKRSQTRAFTE